LNINQRLNLHKINMNHLIQHKI